ncbi:MAG TPA: hypothetical protein VFV30_00515 [Novosphingobium sp.]|nr:hypothetical protein [Novosphingobium sp.]
MVSGPPAPGKAFNPAMVVELLRRLAAAGIAFIKTEQLDLFDGQPGFSLGQDQQPERISQGVPACKNYTGTPHFLASGRQLVARRVDGRVALDNLKPCLGYRCAGEEHPLPSSSGRTGHDQRDRVARRRGASGKFPG